MYEIEAIELMRRNINIMFDNIIEELALHPEVTWTEFTLKVRNIESLREEMNCSFDGIICYIYRQLTDSDDLESIF